MQVHGLFPSLKRVKTLRLSENFATRRMGIRPLTPPPLVRHVRPTRLDDA
jgi:hypothetical protein